MISINEYIKPQTIEQAYELCQKKNSAVIGGMLWLKMQNKTVNTAIDLSDLGLNSITETDLEYKIGAYVTLRQLEMHEQLNKNTNNTIKEAVQNIVGVQFRNLATIGGSVFGKFGFSDVSTVLLSLDAKLEFAGRGIMSLSDFLSEDYFKDILLNIIIPKDLGCVSYSSVRKTKTDFPIIACALSITNGNYLCSIGARPARAKVISGKYDFKTESEFAQHITEQFTFGSNRLGSAKYRQHLCKVLVERNAQKIAKEPMLCK